MNLMETILSGGKEWSRVTKKKKKELKNRQRTEKVKTGVISGDV